MIRQAALDDSPRVAALLTAVFDDRVTPAFRGRGLGHLMKQVSLTRAAASGITRVITQNDDTNAPMVAINERLGYTPFSTGHSWVLER